MVPLECPCLLTVPLEFPCLLTVRLKFPCLLTVPLTFPYLLTVSVECPCLLTVHLECPCLLTAVLRETAAVADLTVSVCRLDTPPAQLAVSVGPPVLARAAPAERTVEVGDVHPVAAVMAVSVLRPG